MSLVRLLLPIIALAGLVFFLAGPGQASAPLLQWWLFNSEPPGISIEAPSSPVRGEVRFSIRLDPPGRASVTSAELNGTPLPAEEELVIDTRLLPDGEHQLVVQAQDRSLWRNTAQQTIVFEADNTPPEIEVQLAPAEPVTGGTVVVQARLSEPATLSAWLGSGELRFYGDDETKWTLLGIPPDPPEKLLELRLEAVDRAGNQGVWARSYELSETEFLEQRLEVSPQLQPLMAPEIRSAERERLDRIHTFSSGPPRWQGPFLVPVDGPVTTPYGALRTYADPRLDNHHVGIDLAAPYGEPVRATADGRVVFTDYLELRGNTVIVDHGAGVLSLYAHLEEFLVTEGDSVRKGDEIALVGSTGLSTGPHLHWEVWVGGASVDPLEWTVDRGPWTVAGGP